MIYYANAERVTMYNSSDGVNQSSLKKIFEDPSFFSGKEEEEEYYTEKEWKITGTGVDVIITQGQAEFDNQFYLMSTSRKPSKTLMGAMQKVFSIVSDQNEPVSANYKDYAQLFCMVFNDIEYFIDRAKPDWREDNRINALAKDAIGDSYWKAMYEGIGKQIITVEEKETIEAIRDTIHTHHYTKDIFDLSRDSEDYDLLFQVPIFFYYNGILCKGLLDMVFINHKTSTVYPLDIKTTGKPLYQFPQVIRERRYDFQGAFYTHGIKDPLVMETLSSLLKKNITSYNVKNLGFIAACTKFTSVPNVIFCTDQLLSIGQFGRPAVIVDGIEVKPAIKGFAESIELYKYYSEHGFDTRKELIEGKGWLNVNWEGIV